MKAERANKGCMYQEVCREGMLLFCAINNDSTNNERDNYAPKPAVKI